MTVKFDPKKFDPRKVDASDVKITDVTKTGRAFQFVGGVRPKTEPKPASQKE